MFATRLWHVAARSSELGADPISRTICEAPIAFFRDDAGRAQAIGAVCPHRGVDLGQGKVVEGALQCPFHGMRFAGDGRCVGIPSQAADDRIPTHLRAPAYTVVEQQGLIWVWAAADEAAQGAPPVYEFLDEKVMPRAYHQAPMTFEASYLNTMENALDGGHLAFVHTGSLPGAPAMSKPYTLVFDEDGSGFRGELAVLDASTAVGVGFQPQRRRLGFKDLAGALIKPFLDASPLVKSTFFYELNGLVYFDSRYANGKREYIYSFFAPVDEMRTMAISGHVRDRALNPVADLLIRRFMDVIMEEDKAMLRHLTPAARGAGGLAKPALVKGDYTSAPFRRLYGNALRREGKRAPWLPLEPEKVGKAAAA